MAAKVPTYADLADLPEDQRIQVIGEAAEQGLLVGFVVETKWKADRYIRKLARYNIRILDTSPGPIPKSVLVRVGPILQ